MSRNNVFSLGEFYHLYNRGTEKRMIFNSSVDHERFLMLLYLMNSRSSIKVRDYLNYKSSFDTIFLLPREESIVDIGAYCLMPNHFHLLVKEKIEGGTSLFMQKLSTAYSMYFNKKHERSGSLFQGKFRSEHVTSDVHLKYLFSYIHLNPIKIFDSKWKENGVSDLVGAKKFLHNYIYSSYLDYQQEKRSQSKILKSDSFPDYFSGGKDIKVLTEEWLEYKKEFTQV